MADETALFEPDEEEDGDKLVDLVCDRYDKASKYQNKYLLEAEEARLYYRGDQWLVKSADRWVAPPKDPWKVRLTINRLPPAVEGAISMFLKARPIIICSPGSDDDAAFKSAKITEKVLYYFWDHLEMEALLEDLLRWEFVTGNSFLRVRWDPQAGKMIPIFEQQPLINDLGLTSLGPDGQPMTQSVQVGEQPEGEPCVDVVSCFEMSVEPGATSLDDAAWIVITEILLRDEVEKKFGVDLKDHADGKASEAKIRSRAYAPISLDGLDIDNSDRIELLQCFEKPTQKYPDGRIIYCTRYKHLRTDPMTAGNGLVQFSNIKLPGELWATSRTSQAVPLQTEYNKIRSQMVEDRRLMGRPKWVAPEGCLQIQEIDNKPGQIIFYDPVAARGVPPRAERGVGTNPSNFQEVQLASEEINDVMSWHEASQGQLSSNVTSGRQAQVYQKADSGSYGPCIRDFERGLKKFGKIFVKCLKENMTNERVGSIIGKNHQHEIFKFSAADISDEATIRFEIASQLPWNRDAVQQTLFWMFTQQLIDKDTLLQYIRMPLESEVYETDQVHKLNAQKENAFLADAFFLPCETDKHQAHILEHMAEINKPDNRERIIQHALQNNGQRPPDIMNMLQHMEAHRKAIPPPQPPPADTKVHLTGQLPPQETIRISQGTVAADTTAKPDQQQQPEEAGGGGVATPPGGGSGELYTQPGNEAMEGVGEIGGGEGIQ